MAREMLVELGPLDVLDADAKRALQRAADDFSRFLAVPVRLAGLP